MLRSRAVFAVLIFAAFNVLWTPLVLPLTAPPYALSHSEIGLFGLAGVAGALGAGWTGKWADRGRGEWVIGLALTLMGGTPGDDGVAGFEPRQAQPDVCAFGQLQMGLGTKAVGGKIHDLDRDSGRAALAQARRNLDRHALRHPALRRRRLGRDRQLAGEEGPGIEG